MRLNRALLSAYRQQNSRWWYGKLLFFLVVIFCIVGFIYFLNNHHYLKIYTLHSYPETGDDWVIFFDTKGKADLIITPNDVATLADLNFVSLRCDTTELSPQIQNDGTLIYPDWYCAGKGMLVNRINKKGNHDLRFVFGPHTAHAHNVGWYDPAWLYRIKLTVQNGKVNDDLTNFPVYVNLDDLPNETFWAHVKANCADVRITKTDGTTELPREIVACATSTGVGELHFKADALANATDTNFYIYYGNANASDYSASDTYGRNAVWNGYKAVYHMQENPTGTIIDSTGNRNFTGMNLDAEDLTTGKVGNGINKDATEYWKNATGISFGSGDNFSFQGWFNITGWNGTNPGFWREGSTSNGTTFNIFNSTTSRPWIRWSGKDILRPVSGYQVTTGTWTMMHFVVTSAATATFYANGVVKHTASHTTTTPVFAIYNFGYQFDTGQDVTGIYDEVRFTTTAPSANWISTDYNNQNSPATFYATSTEENRAILNQNHYRWRDDVFNLNTNAGWLADEDSIYATLIKGETVRLRVEIANTGGLSADNYQYRLEYAIRTGDTCGDEVFALVPTTTVSEHFVVVSTTRYADGDSALGAYLTATGSRTNGLGIEFPSNQTGSFNLNAAYYAEFEYALQATDNATAGASYCFRVTNAGTSSYFSYTIYPQITVAGILSVDIVDSDFITVASPTIAMNTATFSFACQTVTGTLGTATQQIYVNNNGGANNGWTLTLAAVSTTDVWDSAGTDYDFNDANASGCVDGADADSVGGQMTIDASVATLSSGECVGCSTSYISKGSATAFSESGDIVNSVTLLSATADSDNIGDWTLQDVVISQIIPAEQPVASDYDINMVLTITAN